MARAALLLAVLISAAGCGGATPALPDGHPTGAAVLPTGESACSSQRAACHASGTPMPPEMLAAAGQAGPPATVAPAQPAPTSAPEAPPAEIAPTEDPDSRAADENGDYIAVEWGVEITFDEMIEMAQRGEIATIEWYAMPNALRLVTADRQYYHVKNEKYGRNARKELIAAGVKVDKGGIPMNYYFCN